MKIRTIQSLFVTSACLLLLFSCFGLMVFASADEKTFGYLLEEEEAEYRALIQEAYLPMEASIRNQVQRQKGAPADYRIGLDSVIVEYVIDNEDLVLFGADGSGSILPEQYTSSPIFYIPIYGTFGDTERIFGHVRLYPVADGSGYEGVSVFFSCDTAFRNGERKHFLETLTDDGALERLIEEENLGAINEIVLVGLANDDPQSTQGKIAMVETDGGIFVWDLTDAANSDTGEVLYEVGEFMSLREAFEKERSESFGDAVKSTQVTIALRLLGTLLLAVAEVAAVVIAIVLIVRKRIAPKRAVR